MRRHDLVTLRPGASFTFARQATDNELQAAVRAWIDGGRPLVGARQPAGRHNTLQLGLALPTRLDRQRVACLVRRQDVAAIHPPLPLARCLHRLADSLAHPLGELARAVAAAGTSLATYGSLAWEALSGEAYRHVDSDIDILCDVADEAQLDAVLAALAAAAARLPCRLDGELRFADGYAVAWQEVGARRNDPAGEVLAKGDNDVALRPLADLLATLAPRCHHA